VHHPGPQGPGTAPPIQQQWRPLADVEIGLQAPLAALMAGILAARQKSTAMTSRQIKRIRASSPSGQSGTAGPAGSRGWLNIAGDRSPGDRPLEAGRARWRRLVLSTRDLPPPACITDPGCGSAPRSKTAVERNQQHSTASVGALSKRPDRGRQQSLVAQAGRSPLPPPPMLGHAVAAVHQQENQGQIPPVLAL